MLCNIILRIPNKHPDIIYSSNNFNEVLSNFEDIALDEVARLGGESARVITNSINSIKLRGYYCVSKFNKLIIYKKEKNGWFINGELKVLKEFELIYYRRRRSVNNEDYINEEFDERNSYDNFLNLFEQSVVNKIKDLNQS